MTDSHTIKLIKPIKQGNNNITEITLRKPMAGELRGIKLLDIIQMDVAAYAPLLPRITTPALTETQINTMDLMDMMQFMEGIQRFFIKPEDSQPA